ncbi:UV radiation resistance-associated [Rhynchospora pubera]|uniref:UV radiation resistance-associated n=1 Tax=Rhynchospora pubera TaxID=906938 RepID=A0AAV8EFW0_9POAL|nr:UV radiation resistance-associated [Rhynchospora pubera]KAJ4780133.1 UV radiation resistance-associated [Rhynchospora pubera]
MEGSESEPDRTSEVEAAATEVEWHVVSADDVAGVEAPKVVEWEDMEQEIARLWSLSSALRIAKERKEELSQRLASIIEARAESLQRVNELEDMKKRLEARKAVRRDMLDFSDKSSEDVEIRIEQLSLKIRNLLVAGKTLSAAHNQLQEAKNLLTGENGHGRLKKTKTKLRMRQQYMVAQIASIYPVRTSNEHIPMKILDTYSGGSKSGDVVPPAKSISRSSSQSSLTILGWQLMAMPTKKTGYFSDKKEVQKTASVLGFAAHALHLIASYLKVPLRYPLRLGGSRSYIHDYSPSVDSSQPSTDSAATSPNLSVSSSIPTEFPLFFDGQETITRAAYAIFLLNKDLEQVLNYIGAESLGPRHILPNLKELMRIILSDEFLDR